MLPCCTTPYVAPPRFHFISHEPKAVSICKWRYFARIDPAVIQFKKSNQKVLPSGAVSCVCVYLPPSQQDTLGRTLSRAFTRSRRSSTTWRRSSWRHIASSCILAACDKEWQHGHWEGGNSVTEKPVLSRIGTFTRVHLAAFTRPRHSLLIKRRICQHSPAASAQTAKSFRNPIPSQRGCAQDHSRKWILHLPQP